jgi:hypothetical protein
MPRHWRNRGVSVMSDPIDVEIQSTRDTALAELNILTYWGRYFYT